MSTLPTSINTRNPEPGFRYIPDRGEHTNHVLVYVGDSAVRFAFGKPISDAEGKPLRSWLIRCETCGGSFTCPPEDGNEP